MPKIVGPSIYLSGNTYEIYKDPLFKDLLKTNSITALKNALGEWQYVCLTDAVAKELLEFIHKNNYDKELSCIVLHNTSDASLYKLCKNEPKKEFNIKLATKLNEVFSLPELTSKFFEELNSCSKNYSLLNLYSVASSVTTSQIPGVSELRPKDSWEKSGFVVDEVNIQRYSIDILGPTFSIENILFNPDYPEENRLKLSQNDKYLPQIIDAIADSYVNKDYTNTLFGFDALNYSNTIKNILRFDAALSKSGNRDRVLSCFSEKDKDVYITLTTLKDDPYGAALFYSRSPEFGKVYFSAVRRYVDFSLNEKHEVLTHCSAPVVKNGTSSRVYKEISLQGVKVPIFKTEQLKDFAHFAYNTIQDALNIALSKRRGGKTISAAKILKDSQDLALRYAHEISVYKKKGLTITRDMKKMKYDDTSFLTMCSKLGVKVNMLLPKILSEYLRLYPDVKEKYNREVKNIETNFPASQVSVEIEKLRNIVFREGMSLLFYREKNLSTGKLEPNALQKVVATKTYESLLSQLSPKIMPDFSMIPDKSFAERLVSSLPFDRNSRVIENDSENAREFLFRAFKTFAQSHIHTYDNGFERNPTDFDSYARGLLGKRFFAEYEANPLVSGNLRTLESDFRALHLLHSLSSFSSDTKDTINTKMVDIIKTYPPELIAHLFIKTANDHLQKDLLSIVKQTYTELGRDFDKEKDYLTKLKANNIIYETEQHRGVNFLIEDVDLKKELDKYINKNNSFKKVSGNSYYLIPKDNYSNEDARDLLPLLSFINDSGIAFKNPHIKPLCQKMELALGAILVDISPHLKNKKQELVELEK